MGRGARLRRIRLDPQIASLHDAPAAECRFALVDAGEGALRALPEEAHRERVRELLHSLRWFAEQRGPGTPVYARAWLRGRRGARLYLHVLLMGPPPAPGLVIDHKNGNGLDCRLANLRWATRQANRLNARPNRGGTSPWKGVSRAWRGSDRWRAQIRLPREAGKRQQTWHIGTYSTQEEAARAWDEAAKQLYGTEWVRFNFAPGDPRAPPVPPMRPPPTRPPRPRRPHHRQSSKPPSAEARGDDG